MSFYRNPPPRFAHARWIKPPPSGRASVCVCAEKQYTAVRVALTKSNRFAIHSYIVYTRTHVLLHVNDYFNVNPVTPIRQL